MEPSVKENVFQKNVLKSVAVIACLIIAFMLVSICVSVVMRYFLHKPLGWVIQTSQYSVIFIAFLGLAWVERQNKHVKVDIVLNRLKPKVQYIMGIYASIVGAIISLIVVISGIMVVIDLFSRNMKFVDVLQIPMGPLFIIVPLGFLLFFIELIRTGMINFAALKTISKKAS